MDQAYLNDWRLNRWQKVAAASFSRNASPAAGPRVALQSAAQRLRDPATTRPDQGRAVTDSWQWVYVWLKPTCIFPKAGG